MKFVISLRKKIIFLNFRLLSLLFWFWDYDGFRLMMGEAEDNNNLAPNAVVKESRFNKFKNLFKKTNEKPQDLSAEPFNFPGETHVFIESEPLPQAKLLPIKKQEQAGSVAKTKKCLSWNSCCEVVKARKKVEEEARPPSPILPKVFFDSNGDFEKEFYQGNFKDFLLWKLYKLYKNQTNELFSLKISFLRL
jgi:hypothetical protein